LTGVPAHEADSLDFNGHVASANGTDYSWNGAISDDWYVAENWTPNGVPGANDTATLGIDSTINLTTPATVDSFTQTAGTLTGNAILSVSSTFVWSGGTETGAGSTFLQQDSVLQISGSAAKTLNGRTLNLFGITTWTGTGNIIFNSGEIRNQPSAFFEIQTDADLIDADGPGTAAAFINNGIFYKTAGALGIDATEFIDVTFADSGPTAVVSGELRLAAPGSASNAFIEIAADAQLTLTSHFALFSGSLLTNSGTVLIGSGGTLDADDALALAGTFEVRAGGTLASDGDITIDGTVNWIGGTISSLGTQTTISAFGTLNVSGAAARTLDSRLVNEGLLLVESATLTFVSDFTQEGGTTMLSGGHLVKSGTLVFHGGALLGSGTIDGDVSSDGTTIQPGGPGAPGVIAITGDCLLSATTTLEIEIGGTAPGTQFDQLNVGGAATFGGTLNATLINGFTPVDGQTFAVLPYLSHSGAFSPVNLPPNFEASALATAYTLIASAPKNVVTTALDVVDANDNVVSLREAILYANSHPGFDSILFNIPGAGVHTINLNNELPAITETAIINGYSQPGATVNTLAQGDNAVLQIELHDGGPVLRGLWLSGNDITIRGLAITGGFFGGIDVNGANATIAGNFIGLDATGVGDGNEYGVLVNGAANAIIGGTTPADRNIISGNGTGLDITNGAAGSHVQGNYIGTNPMGTLAVANDFGYGILLEPGAHDNLIGGTLATESNLISGNRIGVWTRGSVLGEPLANNSIEGNTIGTDASGILPLGNNIGIYIAGFQVHTTIGGTAAGAGNLIAFNQIGLLVRSDARGEIFLRNSIQQNVVAQIDLIGEGGFQADGPTPNDGGTPPDTDGGGNDLQNYPVVSAAFIDGNGLHFRGSLASTPNTTFRLEFFEKSATGAGGVLLPTFLDFRTVTTDAQGFASFDFLSTASAQLGDQVVATATDTAGAGTSELAPAVIVTPPQPSISIADAIVVEGGVGTTALVFTLTLDHAQPGVPVTVNFTTSDFTAHAGSDYVAKTGTVTFAAGETQQTITIDVIGDTLAEFRERFHLTLSDPTYATIGDGAAFGIIQDDDHHFVAAGSGHGGRLVVFQTTSSDAAPVTTLQPYGAAFKGAVRVAVGDINGDGIDDFAAGAGSSKNGRVRIFDGATMLPFADAPHAAFADLAAFPGYRGGVFVAVGDVNGDGFGDLIVSTSSGRSNMVKVFSGADATLFASFQAFGANVVGVRVATGDVNGDGYADIVAGSGNGSAVKIFDVHNQPATPVTLQSFDRVFAKSYLGGVLVATGDLADATHLGGFDGTDDLIVSAGKGRPNVRILPDLSTAPAQTILAYARPFRGVRVAAADVNGDGIADLLAAQGTAGGSRVSVLSGLDFTKLFDFSLRPKSSDGVYVG
jgi:hypothetical protein